jgi:anti-sigma factor (TIGR02949 family)
MPDQWVINKELIMARREKMKNVERPCPDHEKCLHVINLVIDGEATKEEEAYFYKHVKDCLHCAQYYKLEQSIREAIRKKLEVKEAPEELIVELRRRVKDSFSKSSDDVK